MPIIPFIYLEYASYMPINIGPPYNLYSAVGSGSVFSWLFAPPYWRRFFHVNICVYFIPKQVEITVFLRR
jgi:hypothetical protein